MGSIEASFIAMARYARDNAFDLTWFPLWYSGMPFQNTYQPGLHLTVALASWLSHSSAASAYHFITALTYCLGPVTLFLMARGLTGSIGYSFAAALLYSLTSPGNLLVTVVRNDVGSVWFSRRLQALVPYGEGPHVTSLMLISLALLAAAFALKDPSVRRIAVASAALAMVVLTNWPGSVVLAAAILALFLAQAPRELPRAALVIASASALGYALCASWIPPSTVRLILSNAQKTGNNFGFTPKHLLYLAGVLIAAAIWVYVCERLRVPMHLRLFTLFTFFMASVDLGYEWGRVILLPQPSRFHLALELGIVLTVVFSLKLLLDKKPDWRRPAFIVLCLLLILPFLKERKQARNMLRRIDITKTSEFRTSAWLATHMSGQRAMVPGSTSFWMNAWNDVPQISGCCDQGIVQQSTRIETYVVQSDDGTGTRGAEISKLWLTAYGAQAVATSGPASSEVYHPFLHWRKFDGVLPLLWREGDDSIYAIPQPSTSLAHVVKPTEWVKQTPENGIDTAPLLPYVAALLDASRPQFDLTWKNRHEAQITGHVQPGDLISVQIAAHPGWHVSQPATLRADALGFMLIDPQCQGLCTMALSYDGGWEMRIARIVSWTALLLVIVAYLFGWKLKPFSPTSS